MKKGKEIKCCDTQRRIPCPQLCLHIWAVPQLSRDSFCLHLYRLIVFFSFFFPIRYTSVGNRSNTQPNAALRVVDPLTGSETYRPAYLLHDCLTERQGRLWRAVPSSLYLGPPGIIRPSTQRRVLIPQQYGWYLLRVLYASPVLPKSLLCAKGLF